MNNNSMYDEYNNQTNNMNNSQTYINSNNTMNNNPTYVNSNNPNNNQFINPNNGNSTYVNPNINMANNNANGNQYVNPNNMNGNQYVNPNYSMDNSMYVNPNDLNNKKKKNPLKIVTTVTGILIVLFLAGFGLVYTGVIKINYVSPKSMLLNVGNVALKKGREYQLEYQVYPENTSVKNVYFESSDPSVMEVNEVTGYVTAKKNGSAYVVVKTKDNDQVVDTTLVTVTNDLVPAEKIILSSEKLVFDLSNTTSKLLKVSTEPSNATDKKFDFFSGDENVAVVDEKGYVTPVGFGRTKINVTTKDGSVKTTCDVVVTDSKNKKVYFTGIDNKKIIYPYAIELETDYIKLKPETTRKVGFTLLPPDVTEDVVSWISADSKIATVKDGVVRGEGLGITTVTAITVNDLVAKLTVEITNEDVEITELETREEVVVLTVGEKKRVDLKYNAEATNNIFDYSSDNVHIVTVNENGMLEAIGVGETDIIVTTKKHLKLTIHVIVNPLPSDKDLAIDDKDINLDIGSTVELPNTNSDGEKINGSWIVDDDSVISIDEDDVAQGTLDGTTNIGYVDNDGNVTYLPVSSNSVLPTKLTIESYENIKLGDDTQEIQYTFEPVNTTDKSIKWSYSEEGIIEIDEQNIIKTLKVGKVTVTATSVADENIFTTFDVNVTKKDIVDSKPNTSVSKNNNKNNNNNNSNNNNSNNNNDNNNNGNSGSNDNNTGNGSTGENTNNNVVQDDKEVTGIKFKSNISVECPSAYPYLLSKPNLNVKVGESVSYVCVNENDVKVTYKGTMTEDVYSDLNVSNVKITKGQTFDITDATVKINGITTLANVGELKFNYNSNLISNSGNRFYSKRDIEYDTTIIPLEVSYKNLKKTISVTINTKLEDKIITLSAGNTIVSGAGTEIKPNLTFYQNGKILSNTSGLTVNYSSRNSSVVKIENNRLITQDVSVTSKATIEAYLADDKSVSTTFEVTVNPVYNDFKVNSFRTTNGASPLITGSIIRNGKTIVLSNNDFSSISFEDSRISYANRTISYDSSLKIDSSKLIVKYNVNNKEYVATTTVTFYRVINFSSISLYPGECKDIKDSNNIKVTNITMGKPKSSYLYVQQSKICAVDAEISSKIEENINVKYDGLSKSVGVTLNKNKYSSLNLNHIMTNSGGKISQIKGTVIKNDKTINVTKNDLNFISFANDEYFINRGSYFEVNKNVNKYMNSTNGSVLNTYISFSLKNDPNIKAAAQVSIYLSSDSTEFTENSKNFGILLDKNSFTSGEKSGITFIGNTGNTGCTIMDYKLSKVDKNNTITIENDEIIFEKINKDQILTLVAKTFEDACKNPSVTFHVKADNENASPNYSSIFLASKTLKPGSKNVILEASGIFDGRTVSIPITDFTLKLKSSSKYVSINQSTNAISVSDNVSDGEKVTIIASLKSNPSLKTEATIIVPKNEYTAIKLRSTEKTLVRGAEYNLNVFLEQGGTWVAPSDMNKYVSYTSSNTKYATVDKGKVKIVAGDSEYDINVTITAKLKSNGKTAQLNIKIPGVNVYTKTCYKYKERTGTECKSGYIQVLAKCYKKAATSLCNRGASGYKTKNGTCYNSKDSSGKPEIKYSKSFSYTSHPGNANRGKDKQTLKCKVSCNKLNSNNVSSNCKK